MFPLKSSLKKKTLFHTNYQFICGLVWGLWYTFFNLDGGHTHTIHEDMYLSTRTGTKEVVNIKPETQNILNENWQSEKLH